MSEYLDNLGKDVFPAAMIDEFIKWCVWEEARPALVEILIVTSLGALADQIEQANTYAELERISEEAGNHAKQIGKSTGPLGISTAEAAAFLSQKLAHAAQEAEFDPEAVAFFATQIISWHAFAGTMFTDMKKKIAAINESREKQEAKLAELWEKFGVSANQ